MNINTLLLFLKNNKYQIIKFIITGLISSFLNFIVYLYLYKTNIDINIASFSGYFIGIVNSFIFSKVWIFSRAKSKRLDKTFSYFILLYILGGIEMTLVINIVIYFSGNYKLAWFLGALLAAINNYLGSKFLLFED